MALSTTDVSNIPNSATIIVGDSAAHAAAVLDVTAVNAGSDGFHVTAGQTLAGHGTVAGRVTIDSGATLAPGNADVGTLTIGGSLTLAADSTSNLKLLDAATYDKVVANDAVSFDGTLNVALAGAGPAFAGGQVYDLFDWTGTASGAFGAVNLPALSGGLHWKMFGDQPFDYSTGEIVVEAVGSASWNVNGDGNYSLAANWDPQQLPVGAGQTATFGNGTTNSVIAGTVKVTIDGTDTLGAIVFDNTNGTSYTLADDGVNGHGLTLDNMGAGAGITVSAGSHAITARLTLADTAGTTIDVAGGAALSIGGLVDNGGYSLAVTGDGNATFTAPINGSGGLTKSGNGIATLSASNGYSGGTTVNGGKLRTTASGALGTGPLAINADGVTSAVTLGVNENVAGLSGTIANGGAASLSIAAGTSLTVNQDSDSSLPAAVSNAGTIAKNGAGSLELAGALSLGDHSALEVQAGTLRLTAPAAAVGTSVTASVADGATLELAGAGSALSTTASADSRATIANNSTAAAGGLLVSAGDQQVGAVTGAGVTVVDSGASLTADSIRQSGADHRRRFRQLGAAHDRPLGCER